MVKASKIQVKAMENSSTTFFHFWNYFLLVLQLLDSTQSANSAGTYQGKEVASGHLLIGVWVSLLEKKPILLQSSTCRA